MNITLRPAIEDDLDFMDLLYTENMKGYVERVYPWNPNLFRANFRPQEYEIVQFEKIPIGFIKVVCQEKDIYLGEIQLKREYQNRGIGTQLIESIKKEVKLSDKRLWLKVIQGNPAENLYQRLGFKVFDASTTHKKMEWKPS